MTASRIARQLLAGGGEGTTQTAQEGEFRGVLTASDHDPNTLAYVNAVPLRTRH